MYNSVVKVLELRYVKTRDEQLNILRACHMDPTAGHLGMKKTVCRISERFMWKGIVKDVKSMVCCFPSCTQLPFMHTASVNTHALTLVHSVSPLFLFCARF